MVFTIFSFETAEESPGRLNRVHSHIDGVESCSSCHDGEFKIQSAKCLKCHVELSIRIEKKTGYHKDKIEGCSDCHEEHQGSESKLIQLDFKDFDHSETGYLISGAHKDIKNCYECHSGANTPERNFSKSFLLKDKKCSACHKDIHHNEHPVCTDCHTTRDWSVDIWIP